VRRLYLLLSLVLIALAPAARAQAPTGGWAPGPRSADNITVELVAMSAWAAPGSTAIVALKQDIAPGWHTYWRNPGDSGGATTLEWTLPTGVKASDIVWPLPRRQRLQSLVNYG
jgi:thiol:disulfide interchange protein DsbD